MNHLDQLIALETEVRTFGFDWPDTQMIIEQAVSECQEIEEAILQQEPATRLQEEIGDLLHTAISLCLFANFDVYQTLGKTEKKFRVRFNALKAIAQEQGFTSLHGEPIETLMELWRAAKHATASDTTEE